MKWLALFFLTPIALISFSLEPWFTPLAEFQFRPSYAYEHYPSVAQGKNPTRYSSNNHLIGLNLGVSFWPNWDAEIEGDFSRTRELNWQAQKIGLQLRYLLLDDVAGDPVSLAVGGQLFFVPTRNMRDVSSPYHSQGNAQLGLSIGKEIDQIFQWKWRFWGYVGAGIANRGAPWLRPLIALEGKFYHRHVLQLTGEGYVGFGGRHRVDIAQMDGYANISHRSIDVGLRYTYLIPIWGDLSFKYGFRPYAHAFPKYLSCFLIEYRFPFSIF